MAYLFCVLIPSLVAAVLFFSGLGIFRWSLMSSYDTYLSLRLAGVFLISIADWTSFGALCAKQGFIYKMIELLCYKFEHGDGISQY